VIVFISEISQDNFVLGQSDYIHYKKYVYKSNYAKRKKDMDAGTLINTMEILKLIQNDQHKYK
jgi:hypothetical protein